MWTTDKTFTPYLLLKISVLCPHCKQGSVKIDKGLEDRICIDPYK